MQNVAVIGASEDTDRVSNLACKLLCERGHNVYAVSLHGRDIHGATGCTNVADVVEPLHTVTMYVSAGKQLRIIDDIIAKKPDRVIFNPGSESRDSERRFQAAGIKTQIACTLVLLSIEQF